MSDVPVEITFTPDKPDSSKGLLTARQANQILHHDHVDIAKDRQRTAFLNKLKKRCPSLDIDAAGQLMLDNAFRAAQAANQSHQQPPTELDISRIVRPHLFHVSEVSGLLIPVAQVQNNSRVQGKWMLCLQRADGRRECVDLVDSLDLGDNERLWFSQRPPAPLPTTISRWSLDGRTEWLSGYEPDLKALFTSITNRLLDLLEFPPDEALGTASTLTLWTMLTYVYPIWGAVPYLSIGGSLSSGKSRLLDVLGLLVYSPIHSSNLTAPSLFRTLHSQGGTVLFDEAERLNDRTPDAGEVRSILLAGYRRGGQATRLEKIGDGFQPMSFEVYGPKAIAGISSMPAALASRCIRIMMFRAGKDSPVPRRRVDPAASIWARLRDDLHCMALTYGAKLTAMADWQPRSEQLNGRNLELWLPILAIATVVEEAGMDGLVDDVKRHAVKSIESAHEDAVPELDEMLLRTLKQMLEDREWGVTPGELLQTVSAAEPSLGARYTPRGISTILTRYGIKTKRTDGKRLLRVSNKQWKAIEQSYGIDMEFDDVDETKGGD